MARPGIPSWTSPPTTNLEQRSSPWTIPCSSRSALSQATPTVHPGSSGTSWKGGPPANARSRMIVQLYKPRHLPKEPEWQLGSAP
jgi:hypothetical protein